jgi:hypothetical protein
MNDDNNPKHGGGDFTMASSSMPDRGLDNKEMDLDETLGSAHQDEPTGTAPGTNWSHVYGRVDTANPNDGPLTADYEDLENPGTTTLDEEFAASGDA